MSILTAIFQAILQALSFILPTSESGHLALFNGFAGREQNTCSALSGAIHIGLAIGIFIAMLKPFISLFKQTAFTCIEIAKNRQALKNPTPPRKFNYMVLIALLPLFIWLIPVGEKGNICNLLSSLNYDSTVLSEGLFFILTGALVFATYMVNSKNIGKDKQSNISLVPAIIFGVITLFAIPVAGLSYIVLAMFLLSLFNIKTSISFRFTFCVAVPVLLGLGVSDMLASANSQNIASIIIGIILSAVISFFAVKFCKHFYNKNKLEPFALYNVAIGLISTIIGIVQLIIK